LKRVLGLARLGWPLFLLCFAPLALAQDERSVTSPDGQIEFRLFLAQPEPGALFHLAYQVLFHGKLLLDTSFLGLEMHNQEPILGANLGLTSSHANSGAHYNSLTAEYMQNGSLGRRLNIEVRAYNNGVAFRYVVPTSLPVEDFQLDDESTEFSFAREVGTAPFGHGSDVPVQVEQRGIGWVAISEVSTKDWPRMMLMATEPKTLMTRLARLPKDPSLAMHARTPVISSWRVISISSTREHLLDSGLLSALEN